MTDATETAVAATPPFSIGAFFSKLVTDVETGLSEVWSSASHIVEWFNSFDHAVDAVAPTAEMVTGALAPVATPFVVAGKALIDAINAALQSGQVIATEQGATVPQQVSQAMQAYAAAKDEVGAALVGVGVTLPITHPLSPVGTVPAVSAVAQDVEQVAAVVQAVEDAAKPTP